MSWLLNFFINLLIVISCLRAQHDEVLGLRDLSDIPPVGQFVASYYYISSVTGYDCYDDRSFKFLKKQLSTMGFDCEGHYRTDSFDINYAFKISADHIQVVPLDTIFKVEEKRDLETVHAHYHSSLLSMPSDRGEFKMPDNTKHVSQFLLHLRDRYQESSTIDLFSTFSWPQLNQGHVSFTYISITANVLNAIVFDSEPGEKYRQGCRSGWRHQVICLADLCGAGWQAENEYCLRNYHTPKQYLQGIINGMKLPGAHGNITRIGLGHQFLNDHDCYSFSLIYLLNALRDKLPNQLASADIYHGFKYLERYGYYQMQEQKLISKSGSPAQKRSFFSRATGLFVRAPINFFMAHFYGI